MLRRIASLSRAMRIARQLVDEIVAHAREEAPNECCGMVAGSNGRATRVYRARNAEASPLRYAIHPQDQFRIMSEIEERGEEIAGDLPLAHHEPRRALADRHQPGRQLAGSRST